MSENRATLRIDLVLAQKLAERMKLPKRYSFIRPCRAFASPFYGNLKAINLGGWDKANGSILVGFSKLVAFGNASPRVTSSTYREAVTLS